MKIWIILKETSQPISHDNVTSTFQKGDFYCIYIESRNLVYKYPIGNIFRMVEEYEGEIYKEPPGGNLEYQDEEKYPSGGKNEDSDNG